MYFIEKPFDTRQVVLIGKVIGPSYDQRGVTPLCYDLQSVF